MDQSQQLKTKTFPNLNTYQINNVLFSCQQKDSVSEMINEWKQQNIPITSPHFNVIDAHNYEEWKQWLYSIPETLEEIILDGRILNQDNENKIYDTNVWHQLSTGPNRHGRHKKIPVYFASDTKSAENAIYLLMDRHPHPDYE
jgi:hypothetical protein